MDFHLTSTLLEGIGGTTPGLRIAHFVDAALYNQRIALHTVTHHIAVGAVNAASCLRLLIGGLIDFDNLPHPLIFLT